MTTDDVGDGHEVLDATLTIRLNSELKRRISQAARRDRRGVGDWMRLVLEEAVEKRKEPS
jgi:predicted transcriptional regulator